MPWRKGNRLRTVSEGDADAPTRRIYEEIKSALSLPGLQLYYPALGVYPTFLQLHWQTVKNVARSEELRTAAECLRADAYTRAHNYFHVPDFRDRGDSVHLADAEPSPLSLANYFHYRDPLILLLFTFQIQAMEGAAGKTLSGPADGSEQRVHAHTAPPPAIHQLPPSISENTAPPPLKKRFEEIRRTLGTPFVSPDLCAFAARPEFLDRYWMALKEMLASPLYPECKHGVRTTAWNLAAQLPGPAELTVDQMVDAGLCAEEVASVARILELFVDYLSCGLLNVAAAKIGLEGGNLPVPSERPPAHDRSTRPAA